MEFKEAIKYLREHNATEYKNVRIAIVKIDVPDDWKPSDNRPCLTTITIDKPIIDYRANRETGEFEKIEVNSFVINHFSLRSLLRQIAIDNPIAVEGYNKSAEKPKILERVFIDSKIDILTEDVEAGIYNNPFNNNPSELKNDSIIKHIVAAKLSDNKHFGETYLEKLLDE